MCGRNTNQKKLVSSNFGESNRTDRKQIAQVRPPSPLKDHTKNSGLKSECEDIFHQSSLWLRLRHDEPQKGRNSCLWLQSRSILSSFGVVFMSCKVNFHVVRSALKYSACRIYVYLLFLLIRSL